MKNIKRYFFIGIIFVSVLGTLLHFAYDWSGGNDFLGLFVPINESIWEHTKLLFFPMILYAVFLNRKARENHPCILSDLICGALFGVSAIIVLFYTYSGITGNHFAVVDILIFYISVLMSFFIVYKRTINGKSCNNIFIILGVAMIFLFIIFTLFPPEIPLFIAP